MAQLQTLSDRVPLLGLIVTFATSSLFGLCNVIVKQVEDVDSFTIAVCRFIGIALPAYSFLIYKKQDPFPGGKTSLWLVVRSIMGTSNLLIHFYGLKFMPIADCNMIAAASPIWTTLFARIFLKEPLKPLDIVNLFITLTGIMFIIRPPFLFGHDPSFEFDNQYFFAALIVFLGSFLQANVYVVLRLLKNVHSSVTLANFGSIGVLESSIFMFTLGNKCIPGCGWDRYMMVSVGLLSFVAQIGLTVALQIEEASKVSIMRKAGDIIFAFLFQILIFQEYPGMWSIIGASLVSLAVFLTSIRKLMESKEN